MIRRWVSSTCSLVTACFFSKLLAASSILKFIRLKIPARSWGEEGAAGTGGNFIPVRTGCSSFRMGCFSPASDGRKESTDSTWETVGSFLRASLLTTSSSKELAVRAPKAVEYLASFRSRFSQITEPTRGFCRCRGFRSNRTRNRPRRPRTMMTPPTATTQLGCRHSRCRKGGGSPGHLWGLPVETQGSIITTRLGARIRVASSMMIMPRVMISPNSDNPLKFTRARGKNDIMAASPA